MPFNLIVPPVVAVLSMVIGFIWYSMPVFGKVWMKETKLTMEAINASPKTGYLYTFLSALVIGAVMSTLVKYLGTTNPVDGAFLGFLAWAGFVFPAFVSNFTFELRSLRLLAIDSGYYLVHLVMTGVIAVLIR